MVPRVQACWSGDSWPFVSYFSNLSVHWEESYPFSSLILWKGSKKDIVLIYLNPTLVSWHEFGCRDDANAWRKSTKEADKHKNFLLQFRK